MFFGVAEDKTLWVNNGKGELAQWGHEASWVDVKVVAPETAAALNTNGTVWIIQRDTFGQIAQKQLSSYECWSAISGPVVHETGHGGYNAMLTLAYDGKLCRWRTPDERPDWPGSIAGPDYLMAQSRLKAITVAKLDLNSN